MTLTVGSLFSGIGGLDLGLSWAGMRHKWFVEQNPDRQTVLADNWPAATIYGDINAIDHASLVPVDLLVGGFPCQGFSLAGLRKGTADDRFLWPRMFEVVQAVRPRWVLAENVPGITSTESGVAVSRVFSDLESCGYDLLRGPDGQAALLDIPACAVNAPHIRHRVFFVAHSHRRGFEQGEASEPGQEGRDSLPSDAGQGGMGDASGQGLPLPKQRGESGTQEQRTYSWAAAPERSGPLAHWNDAEILVCHDGKSRRVKPGVRLLAHGVPGRVARLKGLGNAVVPQVAYMIGQAIIQADKKVAA